MPIIVGCFRQFQGRCAYNYRATCLKLRTGARALTAYLSETKGGPLGWNQQTPWSSEIKRAHGVEHARLNALAHAHGNAYLHFFRPQTSD